MRIIRKYPNRRLYDTEQGAFINLEQLRDLIEQDLALRVEDKASGADITRSMLLQITVEAEESGEPILSETLLRQLIRFHGDALQTYLTRYLEASMDLFLSQADELKARFGTLVDQGPLTALRDIGKQNLAFWDQLWKRPKRNEDDPETSPRR